MTVTATVALYSLVPPSLSPIVAATLSVPVAEVGHATLLLEPGEP